MQEVSFESNQTMTQREFAAFVEQHSSWDLNHYELLNGRVVMNPPAGFPHGTVGSNIQFILSSFIRPRKLGLVFDSSQGFELPSGDTVEPDHSFVSSQRWTAAPAPEEGKFLRLVPDLVVEVLSTSTASRDRGEKKAIYAVNGVGEYWVVNSRARELTLYVLDGKRFDGGQTSSGDEIARSTVLPGLQFAVCELFANVT
jgi:Uma2 family endonuclease